MFSLFLSWKHKAKELDHTPHKESILYANEREMKKRKPIHCRSKHIVYIYLIIKEARGTTV